MEQRYKTLIIIGVIILILVLVLWYLNSQAFFGSVGVPGLQPAQ